MDDLRTPLCGGGVCDGNNDKYMKISPGAIKTSFFRCYYIFAFEMAVQYLAFASLLASQATAQWFPQYIHQRLTGSVFGISNVDAEYDYLVVGGGLAGSVTAARLVENTNATVAVIEGGSFYEMNNGNWSQIPYYSTQWADLDWQPNIDWGMVAEPNPVRILVSKGRLGHS